MEEIKKILNKSNAWLLILGSALIAWLTDFYFHHYVAAIIFFIINIFVVTIATWFWLQRQKDHENKATVWPLVWLFLSLVLSVWLFIRNSSWLYGFNFITANCLILLFWINAQKKTFKEIEIHLFAPWRLLRILPFHFLQPFRVAFHDLKLFSGKKAQVLKGIILALPILIIINALLASADMVYKKYATDFFSFFDLSWLNHWYSHIFIFIYFLIFLSVFYSLIYPRKTFASDFIIVREKDKLILQIISGLLSALLLIFSIIQIKFLFGGAALVEKLGIGYQEYAHQGFYQLLVVAALVFGILWFLGKEKYHEPNIGKLSRLTLGFAFVLIAETILILVSAMKRLWLFIDTLQWATKRFFAFEGMIFLIILLIIFCAYLLIKKFSAQQFLYLFTIVFALNLLSLNILDVDKYIAERNVEKYASGKIEEHQLDFDYTSYVSADGAAAGLKLFEAARTDREKLRAATKLNQACINLAKYHADREKSWLYYNLAKSQAYQILHPKCEEIKQYYSDHVNDASKAI